MPSLSGFDTSEIADKQSKILDSLNQILDSQGLTMEEIKGIVVDTNL